MENRKFNLLIQIGFVVSLVLNGFFLGLVMGGPFMHGPMPPDPSRHLYEAASYLSPESKDKVLAILDKRTPEIDARMKGGMDQGFADIREALTAQEFSPEKLDRATRSVGEMHAQMGETLDGMLREIALALPDTKERISFFEHALPEKPPFGHGRPRENQGAEPPR